MNKAEIRAKCNVITVRFGKGKACFDKGKNYAYIAPPGGEGKNYAYLVPPWVEDLKLLDKIVVETQHGVTVATVTGLNPSSYVAEQATAYVIQKLDLDKHRKAIIELEGLK